MLDLGGLLIDFQIYIGPFFLIVVQKNHPQMLKGEKKSILTQRLLPVSSFNLENNTLMLNYFKIFAFVNFIILAESDV